MAPPRKFKKRMETAAACAGPTCGSPDNSPAYPPPVSEPNLESIIRQKKLESDLMTLRELNKDPWAHRSDGMRCRTCMFYVVKHVPPAALGDDDPRGRLGRCRRHAPTMSGYPAVFGSDWCGDHKLDEAKL